MIRCLQKDMGRGSLEVRRPLRRQCNNLANHGHVFSWNLVVLFKKQAQCHLMRILQSPAGISLSVWLLRTSVLAYSQAGPDGPPPTAAIVWEPPKAKQAVGWGAEIKTMLQWIPNTIWRPWTPGLRVDLQRGRTGALVSPLAYQGPSNKRPSQIKPQQEAH